MRVWEIHMFEDDCFPNACDRWEKRERARERAFGLVKEIGDHVNHCGKKLGNADYRWMRFETPYIHRRAVGFRVCGRRNTFPHHTSSSLISLASRELDSVVIKYLATNYFTPWKQWDVTFVFNIEIILQSLYYLYKDITPPRINFLYTLSKFQNSPYLFVIILQCLY